MKLLKTEMLFSPFSEEKFYVSLAERSKKRKGYVVFVSSAGVYPKPQDWFFKRRVQTFEEADEIFQRLQAKEHWKEKENAI